MKANYETNETGNAKTGYAHRAYEFEPYPCRLWVQDLNRTHPTVAPLLEPVPYAHVDYYESPAFTTWLDLARHRPVRADRRSDWLDDLE